MSPFRRSYMHAALGAVAGLIAWTFLSFLMMFTVPGRFAADMIGAILLGALVGGGLFGAQEFWETRPAMPWPVWGALVGACSACLAIFIYVPADQALRDNNPEWNRVLEWIILGVSLGGSLGLRWIRTKPLRLAFSLMGGFGGGLLGGVMIGFLSGSPDISSATAYTLFGAAVGFGCGHKPTEVHAALLRFIRSSDGKTQSKVKIIEPWNVDLTVSLLIGNPTEFEADLRTNESFVPVWDPAVARYHARVYASGGQFYLARHPDIRGPQQVARYIVRAGDQAVLSELILRHEDEITVGRTVFRFMLVQEEF